MGCREFITQEEGLDLEEVAENYLKELIGRSLTQIVQRNWRTISTCQVHDLLRDLAVNKAKELTFLHISNENVNSALSTIVSSCRRIAFRSQFEFYMSLDHSHQRVHTLSFLNNEYLNSRECNAAGGQRLMTLLYSKLSSLRVLDLEQVCVTGEVNLRFDEVVGKLIHLRYLGLNHTGINKLPETIGNLQALQNLNVSSNEYTMLPTNIFKLKQLRHLKGCLVTGKGSLVATTLLFDELTNLQCLKYVNINHWLRQKGKDEFALNAFAKLRNLKIFSAEFSVNYLLSLERLLNCSHLIELKIYGGIQNLPEEMHIFLPNLKYLNLRWSRLEQDPMPALEMIPNILVLELDHIGVNNMNCHAIGFRQLEVLTLSNVAKLQVEEGAMPRLRALPMDYEGLRGTLPQRLRSLPDRKVLNWDWKNFS